MVRYLGIDGFRSRVERGLTAADAYEIGRFWGWYYGRSRRAQTVVGKGTHRSNSMLEHALSAGRNRYTGYLISPALHSFEGKRVTLDCANGSAWTIAPSMFRTLGEGMTIYSKALINVLMMDKKTAQEDSEIQAALGGRGPHPDPGVRHRVSGLGHGGGPKPGPLPGSGREHRRSPVGEVGRMRMAGAPSRRGGREP